MPYPTNQTWAKGFVMDHITKEVKLGTSLFHSKSHQPNFFYMNYFMADFPKFSWRISTVHSLPNNSSCYQKRIQIESLHPLSTKNGATRNKAISRLTLTFSNHLIPTFTFTSTSMWRPTSVSKPPLLSSITCWVLTSNLQVGSRSGTKMCVPIPGPWVRYPWKEHI